MPEAHSTTKLLIAKLKSLGPPSLTHLANYLSGAEDYTEFAELIREILPERELEILGEPTIGRQITTFASYFQDRYFPLHQSFFWDEWAAEMTYCDFLRGVPVILQSFSNMEYHELPGDDRAAQKLLTYLVEPQYGESQARIPLGESCLEYVSMDLLEKVPKGGFQTEDLEKWLKGTPYEGLINWAKIVTHDTGNDFIDIDEDDLYSGMELPPWNLQTVEYLTQEWHEGVLFWRPAEDLLTDVETDPANKFEELLNFILEKRDAPQPRKKETLYEIFAENSEEKGG